MHAESAKSTAFRYRKTPRISGSASRSSAWQRTTWARVLTTMIWLGLGLGLAHLTLTLTLALTLTLTCPQKMSSA